MQGMRRFVRSVRPEVWSAVVVVLVLVAASLAVVRATGHRPHAAGVAKVAVTPAPLPTSEPTSVSTVVSLPPTARPLPSVRSTAVVTRLPVGRHLPASPVASASVTECVGPLPPGHAAEPACDVGKHKGLPTGCRWDGFCAWWDAWGAVLGGPQDVPIDVTPAGDLDVSWDIDPRHLEGSSSAGPLKELVLRVFADDSHARLRQYELGVDARSMTVSGLGPGTYDVCVMELNDSGLGGLCPGPVTIAPAPSETPTATATPTPTPAATSTA